HCSHQPACAVPSAEPPLPGVSAGLNAPHAQCQAPREHSPGVAASLNAPHAQCQARSHHSARFECPACAVPSSEPPLRGFECPACAVPSSVPPLREVSAGLNAPHAQRQSRSPHSSAGLNAPRAQCRAATRRARAVSVKRPRLGHPREPLRWGEGVGEEPEPSTRLPLVNLPVNPVFLANRKAGFPPGAGEEEGQCGRQVTFRSRSPLRQECQLPRASPSLLQRAAMEPRRKLLVLIIHVDSCPNSICHVLLPNTVSDSNLECDPGASQYWIEVIL
ncbi:uncharacterized protein LOC122546690, partial [Chiloscyllium plagiosum]|uniref:uncharacterized protein LOC122546690 n=1 Tax=Chiloscyllium plagiosum TaxID=36176 RepID=UPI001CB800F7